jgi:outer membrane protein
MITSSKVIYALVIASVPVSIIATPSSEPEKQKQPLVVKASSPIQKIVVVDPVKVGRESFAGQDIDREVQERVTAYRQKAEDKQRKYMVAQQETEAQKAVLDPEIYKQKQATLAQDYQELMDFANQCEQELQALMRKKQEDLMKTIQQSVSQVAKEEGADIVIPEKALYVAKEDFDITPRVIAHMNKSYTSKLPQASGKQPAATQTV